MADRDGTVPNPAADRPPTHLTASGSARDGSPDEHSAGGSDDAVDDPMSRTAKGAIALADRLPDWIGSVRFRLTALYSFVLFGLVAFMIAGLYGIIAARLGDERVYRTYQVTSVEQGPGGLVLTPTEVRASYRSVEALANERALMLLRTYSLSALVLLFFVSLVVGWFVAGRVLAPIGRITSVARNIGATDLSRRIALDGPPDELKELADTFDAMLSRLDDAFASQQRFIQEASHELRNPLAVMRTNLDVALDAPEPDPGEVRRVAELARASTARMSRLVDDLLVYARLGAPAHDVVSVDLDALIEDAGAEFRSVAATRSLTLVVDGGSGATVTGDRIALRQAVANLLHNAVRLAPEGSTIWLGAGTADGTAWITVTDEGPGLSEDDREHVFERFWSGDKPSARREGRSGLGLAIVEQIVRDHHGEVSVQPTVAGGSVFTILLPCAPPAPPAPAVEAEAAALPQDDRGGPAT